MTSGWPASVSGSSPSLVAWKFHHVDFADGTPALKHIAIVQKSTSKSVSISQLDIFRHQTDTIWHQTHFFQLL
jgi:hypothetical protein